jgi:uncharacterized protein
VSATARTIDVEIPAGVVCLAGTLWLPNRYAGSTAAVMVHGSGAMTRDNDVYFPPIRDALIGAGVAVLAYDKRGVGGSTGDWTTSDLSDLADDAAAAATFLRERPETDRAAIGLFGHSQGGWIVPIAASRSREVDWIVTNSGPGVTVWEQVVFDVERHLREAGIGGEDRRRLLDSMDRLVAAIRAGEPYERRVELMRAVRAQAEGGYLPIMETPEQLGGDQRWWILFDPEPILRGVRCPVLAIFGELDPVVPVGPSVEVFNEALRGAGAGNHDVTIEVFPGAGHRIEIADAFAPGYLETLTAWVARRTR